MRPVRNIYKNGDAIPFICIIQRKKERSAQSVICGSLIRNITKKRDLKTDTILHVKTAIIKWKEQIAPNIRKNAIDIYGRGEK